MPLWFSGLFRQNDYAKFSELLASRIINAGKNGNMCSHDDIKKHVEISTPFKTFLEKGIAQIFNNIDMYSKSEQEFLYREIFYLIFILKLGALQLEVYKYVIENCPADPKDDTDLQKLKLAISAYSEIQTPNKKDLKLFWSNMWLSKNKKLWPVAFDGLCKQDADLACQNIPLLISRTSKFIDILFKMWENPKIRPSLQSFFKLDGNKILASAKSELAYKLTNAYDIPFSEAMALIYGMSSRAHEKVKQ
jgi:hypothetical protein